MHGVNISEGYSVRRAYIETSVWGMVPADQNAALRHPTLEFLLCCENRIFVPHISRVVTDEIRDAPQRVQDAIISRMGEVNPVFVPISDEVESLARRFVEEKVLPPRRLTDGLHVACAIVSGLDLLVSWNYRHIANVSKAEAFNAVAVLAGLPSGIEIHTPLEVLGWK